MQNQSWYYLFEEASTSHIWENSRSITAYIDNEIFRTILRLIFRKRRGTIHCGSSCIGWGKWKKNFFLQHSSETDSKWRVYLNYIYFLMIVCYWWNLVSNFAHYILLNFLWFSLHVEMYLYGPYKFEFKFFRILSTVSSTTMKIYETHEYVCLAPIFWKCIQQNCSYVESIRFRVIVHWN